MSTHSIRSCGCIAALGVALSGCSGLKSLSPSRLWNSTAETPAPPQFPFQPQVPKKSPLEKVTSLIKPAAKSPSDKAANVSISDWLSTPGSGQDVPPTRDGLIARARVVERDGSPERAAELYKQVIALAPTDPLPYHRLGVIAARQTRYAEAERHFRQALSVAPPSAKVLSDLGYLYYLQGRYPEAEAVLRQATHEFPMHEASWNNLGLALGAQGRDPESLAAFKRVHSEAEAKANYAYVLTQRGEIGRAKELYTHAIELDNSLKPAAKALLQIMKHEDAAKVALNRAQQTRQEAELAGHAGQTPLVDTVNHQELMPESYLAPDPGARPGRSAQPSYADRLPPVIDRVPATAALSN